MLAFKSVSVLKSFVTVTFAVLSLEAHAAIHKNLRLIASLEELQQEQLRLICSDFEEGEVLDTSETLNGVQLGKLSPKKVKKGKKTAKNSHKKLSKKMSHLEVPPPVWTPEATPPKRLQVEKYVPIGELGTHMNDKEISRKILDRSAQVVINEEIIARSSVLKSAQDLEKSMQADVTAATTTTASGEVIEHKFTLNLEAFQQAAKIRYDGFLDAEYMYFSGERFQLDLKYSLSNNTRLLLQTQKNHDLQTNQFIWQMNW